ncbi:MAG TPA: hypothetical protein VNU66_09090 [Mycobacteriales bacterium]|nr:hypothetical protein [Mycobacteriales bacterium]
MSSPRRIRRTAQRTTTVLGVAGGLAGLTLASPATAAAAADGAPTVVNRETVQAKLDATGELQGARVYNQLTVLGKGSVSVQDPTSGSGLRDLDGFSAPVVRDGKAQYSITVDGREDRRTVADYKEKLPITVKAEYKLDGKEVAPEDVVGKSGTLETTYTVVNRTATPTEVTYLDGNGKEIKETVDLVTPYVGSLGVVLPKQFSEVGAEFADVAGDGRGGTGVKWSLVLFDPLGAPAQQLTWTAKVSDAELPPAVLQAVPVAPGGNQVLANSETSISEGAAAASQLTAGATKIDGKVLELRDGARKILDGVSQLAAGAKALNSGLADTAAPGARTLSDGLGSAREGGAKLDDGLAQLLAGSTQLSDGLDAANTGGAALAGGLQELLAGGGRFVDGLNSAAAGGGKLAEGLRSTSGQPDLAGGAAQIAAGLASVRDGVAVLAGDAGLPAAKVGLEQLLFGLDHAPGTLGATDPGGLLQGLTAIAAGLSHPVGAAGPADRGGVKEGLAAVLDPATGLPAAKAGVTASKEDLTTKLATSLPQLKGAAQLTQSNLATALTALKAACDTIVAAQVLTDHDSDPATDDVLLPALPANCDLATDPVKAGTANGTAAAVTNGVQTVIENTTASRDGLIALEAGLTGAVGGLTLIKGGVDQLAAGSEGARKGVAESVVPGVQKLLAGVGGAVTGIQSSLAPGVTQLAAGSATLATKTGEAADGAAALKAGLDQLAGGGGQLAAGAGKAADGAKALSGGLGQLAAGGGKLEAGLGSAKEGTAKLSDGLGQLDDGGAKLADGLGAAAEGSGKIADGLAKVEDGQTQLADGANRLSGEGTSLLARSAGVAAASNAKKAAMLQAMGEKAADGALPFGLPEGATGSAAYSITLAGANSQAEDNTTRGAAALALLALGSLSGFAVRRRTGA